MKDNGILLIVFAAGLGIGYALRDCMAHLEEAAKMEIYVQELKHAERMELLKLEAEHLRSMNVSASNEDDMLHQDTES